MQAPNQLLNLRRLSHELTGLGLDDEWTCYQFDSAVLYFGTWAENRMNEMDDKGKPRYTLKQILSESLSDTRYEEFKQAFAAWGSGKIEKY